MFLEHLAIYTNRLEEMKDFYGKYFGGIPNEKYVNQSSGFESYFLQFASGARLELMKKPGIPDNANDTVDAQHLGIIHLAFGVDTMQQVNEKAEEMKADGFRILRGPRKTGDGYYEFETLDPDKNRLEITTAFVGP